MKRLVFASIFLVLLACSPSIRSVRRLYKPNELDSLSLSDPFIKVHLKNGYLAVLRSWNTDNASQTLSGIGTVYNLNRKVMGKRQPLSFSYDDCVLVETNSYSGYNFISPALMTFSVAMGTLTLPCLFDPKACFGSCPTFYLIDQDSLIIQAEGFSSSISKSLEATDIDRLSAWEKDMGTEISIALKNEALETHYLRNVHLFAVPKETNERIYQSSGRFIATRNPLAPLGAAADVLSNADRNEYFTESDSLDLAQKESIILDFEPREGASSGLVITQRQSLMTTFLFYQSMAYMGTKAGYLLSAYERMSPAIRATQKTMYDLLGGVEVSVMIDGNWKKIGVIDEQGPITTDSHLLPVNQSGTFSQVKLTMTKGLWRIDQVNVCELAGVREPVSVEPQELLSGGVNQPELLSRLTDSEQFLVNNPGVDYTLKFTLPDYPDQEVFLVSQGYYTEWMREQWLAEEDPEMVQLMVGKPAKWLKQMAPKYKQVEPVMESLFWESKFSGF